MRVLVTGATGYLGRSLVPACLDNGFEVRALVRDPRRARKLFPDAAVDLRRGDLADPASLEGIAEDIEVVFHLGAATSGGWPIHERVTVAGTRRLLRQAADAGVRRFVHVSSIAVYDLARLPADHAISEDHALLGPDPDIGPYARGKVIAERIVAQATRDRGLDTVILRPGLVYGHERILLPHLGRRLGRLFLAVGRRDFLLPLVHIDSVISALMALAHADTQPGAHFHVVDEHATTRADYVRALNALGQGRYRCVHMPVWAVATACGVIGLLRRLPALRLLPDTSFAKIRQRDRGPRYDTSALQAATGWRPRTELGPPWGDNAARSERTDSYKEPVATAAV